MLSCVLASAFIVTGSILDILVSLFHSGRPYKLILRRLDRIHGINRSLRWLKLKFKELGLFRRPRTYTPECIVMNCIKVIVAV